MLYNNVRGTEFFLSKRRSLIILILYIDLFSVVYNKKLYCVKINYDSNDNKPNIKLM